VGSPFLALVVGAFEMQSKSAHDELADQMQKVKYNITGVQFRGINLRQ
jgi:hypothetical protein